MSCVRVSGSIGSISLWTSNVTYFLSFIIYLISFSLPDWIVYKSIPVKIGIWRLCDIQIAGYDRCADWSSRIYPTNQTNLAFLGPPDFIRTSQSLEIVTFVFCIISGILLIIGLCQKSFPLFFFGSSMSMFIKVIFSSSTIVLFAVQGKSAFSGYLSFAWWLALISTIVSLIYAVSSLILSFYIEPIQHFNENNKTIESTGKVYYASPPYSTNVYDGQDINNEYIR